MAVDQVNVLVGGARLRSASRGSLGIAGCFPGNRFFLRSRSAGSLARRSDRGLGGRHG